MSNKPIPTGKYPTTYYRVSLKAIIENDRGEILCVKENGSDWELPGGGLDHGETIEQGLAREMDEEVASGDTPFTYQPVGHDVMYMPHNEAWLLWALYRVTFDEMPKFSPGIDGDAVAWIDPRTFKDSEWMVQRLIYKWCVDRNYETGAPIGY